MGIPQMPRRPPLTQCCRLEGSFPLPYDARGQCTNDKGCVLLLWAPTCAGGSEAEAAAGGWTCGLAELRRSSAALCFRVREPGNAGGEKPVHLRVTTLLSMSTVAQ